MKMPPPVLRPVSRGLDVSLEDARDWQRAISRHARQVVTEPKDALSALAPIVSGNIEPEHLRWWVSFYGTALSRRR